MSAVAEKRKTNPAQRLKVLERERARRQEKLEAADAEIEELRGG